MASLNGRCEAAEAARRCAEEEAQRLLGEVEAGATLAGQLQRRIQCMSGQVGERGSVGRAGRWVGTCNDGTWLDICSDATRAGGVAGCRALQQSL